MELYRRVELALPPFSLASAQDVITRQDDQPRGGADPDRDGIERFTSEPASSAVSRAGRPNCNPEAGPRFPASIRENATIACDPRGQQ